MTTVRNAAALVCLICLAWAPTRAIGRDEELVAGRTVEQYVGDLSSDDRVVRLRAVISLGAFGSPASDALRQSLNHSDAAVRYTAAVHLGRIGGEPLQEATAALESMSEDDPSEAVRMAVAYALCRSGKVDEHLPFLISMLEQPRRGTACSAADLLGDLGPPAKAAIDPLEKAYRQNQPGGNGDYHVGGAAQNALRQIRGQ